VLRGGLLEAAGGLACFAAIEPALYRYLAIDSRSLRTAVQGTFRI